jgi:aspartyl-tRNA(Asn)/glutamyl-tRNA(Gln) amidotransferase subunit A
MVKDLQTSAGSSILEGFIAPLDSTTVRRLKQKGAIVVGTANMDEFGMGSYGQYGYKGTMVRNPINSDYFAGGSSAGSAASVRSFQALASIGTDTGGSIGQPAHCCGVVGFKPSYGRVSRFGQILYSSSSDVNGPLGLNVEDVMEVFKVMEGEDERDSNCIDFGKIN